MGAGGYDRYAYVNNNPLRYTDPSGHDPCTGSNKTYMPDCGVNPREWEHPIINSNPVNILKTNNLRLMDKEDIRESEKILLLFFARLLGSNEGVDNAYTILDSYTPIGWAETSDISFYSCDLGNNCVILISSAFAGMSFDENNNVSFNPDWALGIRALDHEGYHAGRPYSGANTQLEEFNAYLQGEPLRSELQNKGLSAGTALDFSMVANLNNPTADELFDFFTVNKLAGYLSFPVFP